MILVDTHSHIYAEEFDADRNEALQRAREAGVRQLLLPAIDSESHSRMLSLAHTEPDYCRAMMGLHPTSVNDNPRWREELALVRDYLTATKGKYSFCAVGEIGLDYYWSRDFVAEQREAFVVQCRWAVELNLPVVIHTREAWGDMVELLEQESLRAKEQGGRLRGVLHAYSEDAATYERLCQAGDFLFGIGGVVTYKKSKVAEAVAALDVGRLLLETDCPYLTPVPHRGKRNESSYVRYVCERVAEIKGIAAEEVALQTSKNACRMFGITID